MYYNVISFTNGKIVTFQSLTPFSFDKLENEWIIVTDDFNKQTISFKCSEVVTISSCDADAVQQEPEKKTGLKIS